MCDAPDIPGTGRPLLSTRRQCILNESDLCRPPNTRRSLLLSAFPFRGRSTISEWLRNSGVKLHQADGGESRATIRRAIHLDIQGVSAESRKSAASASIRCSRRSRWAAGSNDRRRKIDEGSGRLDTRRCLLISEEEPEWAAETSTGRVVTFPPPSSHSHFVVGGCPGRRPDSWRGMVVRGPIAAPMTATSSSSEVQPTLANATTPRGERPEGMVWIPGGEFSMGAAEQPGMNDVGMQATIDSRPIHRVYVDGFWMDATEVTNDAVRKVRRRDQVRDRRGTHAAAEDFPGAPPENLVAGAVVFSPPESSGPAEQSFPVVDLCEGRELAPSGRARRAASRGAIVSGRPDRLRRCDRVRELGRQAAADGSGVGICRARRTQRQALSLGRRVHAGRQVDGQQPSGAFSRSR